MDEQSNQLVGHSAVRADIQLVGETAGQLLYQLDVFRLHNNIKSRGLSMNTSVNIFYSDAHLSHIDFKITQTKLNYKIHPFDIPIKFDIDNDDGIYLEWNHDVINYFESLHNIILSRFTGNPTYGRIKCVDLRNSDFNGDLSDQLKSLENKSLIVNFWKYELNEIH